jgi:oligopeptide/dipeptide ABC transporter ATP-binding protein
MCHRVLVMYAGRIVESAPVERIFRAPAHPYTRALIACLPGAAPGDRLGTIPGGMPGLSALPPGCRFHPRCGLADARCAVESPELRPVGTGQLAACHLAGR